MKTPPKLSPQTADVERMSQYLLEADTPEIYSKNCDSVEDGHRKALAELPPGTHYKISKKHYPMGNRVGRLERIVEDGMTPRT